MASSSAALTQAFVLSPEVAVQLCEMFEHEIGEATITASCADGVQRDFRSVKQLTQYDNLRSRELLRVNVSSRSTDWKTTAAMTLSSKAREPIAFSITAPDDNLVLRVRGNLLSLAGEMRPWYSRVATLDFVSVMMAILAVTVIAIFVGLAFDLLPFTSGASSNSAAETRVEARVLSATLAIAACAAALNKLRARLFPLGVIALGQGAERFRTQETIRWVIVVGLIVSFVGSVVASLLQHGA